MSDEQMDPNRRWVVGAVAAGALAAATAPSRAQQPGSGPSDTAAQGSTSGTGAPDLRNPASKFPQPPFPGQQQDWPGLASEMTPRPDHGEDSYRGSGRLAGRRAVITGGDSGIGRAAAIAFAREGADVAIGYLPQEEPDARDVVRIIEEAGRKAVTLPGDIRDEGFCTRLVEDARTQLGGIDILVNNAARQIAQPSLADITTDQFDATMKTNVYAMFWITKAAIPYLQPGSAIINTASIVAYDPPENLLDYDATKAAIVTFTKGLAKQLAGKGIRVNAVAPGPFWTPLQVVGGQPASAIPTFGTQTPLGRPGQPVELSPLYVTLASSDASYSTGQVFAATGGAGGP